MKSSIKKMTRKDFLYIVLPVIIQSILYFIVKFFAFNIHIINSSFDDKLPFIPYFVYPYVLWYLLLVLVPFIIYVYEKDKLKKYDQYFLICSFISIFIFLVFPTTINRAAIKVNGFSTLIVDIIYRIDTPILNCFPSIHALNSMMWIIFFSKNKKTPLFLRGLIIILSISVILATIFIKQHVIYDLMGSVGVLIVGYLILKIVEKRKSS